MVDLIVRNHLFKNKMIDWFYRHVNASIDILFQEVRKLHTYLHFFVLLLFLFAYCLIQYKKIFYIYIYIYCQFDEMQTCTLSQNKYMSNGNNYVHHTPHINKTGASRSNEFKLYTVHTLLQRIQ